MSSAARVIRFTEDRPAIASAASRGTAPCSSPAAGVGRDYRRFRRLAGTVDTAARIRPFSLFTRPPIPYDRGGSSKTDRHSLRDHLAQIIRALSPRMPEDGIVRRVLFLTAVADVVPLHEDAASAADALRHRL